MLGLAEIFPCLTHTQTLNVAKLRVFLFADSTQNFMTRKKDFNGSFLLYMERKSMFWVYVAKMTSSWSSSWSRGREEAKWGDIAEHNSACIVGRVWVVWCRYRRCVEWRTRTDDHHISRTLASLTRHTPNSFMVCMSVLSHDTQTTGFVMILSLNVDTSKVNYATTSAWKTFHLSSPDFHLFSPPFTFFHLLSPNFHLIHHESLLPPCHTPLLHLEMCETSFAPWCLPWHVS